MSQLHTPRELNFNAENLAEEWRRWEKSFKIYYAAAELASKTVSYHAGSHFVTLRW